MTEPAVTDSAREVLVVTARPDLDLAISLWLPGYRARSVPTLEAAVAAAGSDTVLLIERDILAAAGGPRAVRGSGMGGPLVVLGAQEVIIDLVDDAVVHAPLALEGVREALQLVGSRHHGGARGTQRPRRADTNGGRRRAWWSGRSASSATDEA